MKLVGLLMTYEAEWVLGLSLRALSRFCDEVVVGYQPSLDGTRDIISDVAKEEPGRINIIEQDVEPGKWISWENIRRGQLLQLALEHDATHVAVFDEDEVLSRNLAVVVRDLVEPHEIVWLPWVSMWDSPDSWARSWLQRLPFFYRRNPSMSYRQTEHTRCPSGYVFDPETKPQTAYGTGGVMHLQFVSRRRLNAKRTLYRMMHKVQFPGSDSALINSHYAESMTPPKPHEVEAVPPSWWAGLDGSRQHLKPELPPWQEGLCRELVGRHGLEFFAGINGLESIP